MVGGNLLAHQYRTLSWHRLLNRHKQEFLAWMDENGTRLKMFNKLAEDLEQYVIHCLTIGPFYEGRLSLIRLRPTYFCEQFANCIPDVFTNCDDPHMYEQYMAAQAYAHVHLLERYRRFWDVLISLLEAAVLPMSEKNLQVLDVGTGPAPALYAVSDFYQALHDFAHEQGYISLITSTPKLDGIELSYNMRHFMHIFSEMSYRTNGPYRVTFGQFEGLSFGKLRSDKRRALISREADEQDTSEEYAKEYVDFMHSFDHLYRHHLIIFSNFLTKGDVVANWQKELRSTFGTLCHGGIVVVVGGSGEKYDPIYQAVRDIAKNIGLSEIPEVSTKIPCNYSDISAQRIKEHYNTIWAWIRANTDIDEAFLTSRKIAKKLWNPQKRLKEASSPPEFTLLTFRRSGRPWKWKPASEGRLAKKD